MTSMDCGLRKLGFKLEIFFIKGFFESCGVVATVDESLIDTVIAVSGSSPAYIMRFAHAIIKYGVSMGLNSDEAKSLVVCS